jgi:hypothetical protein
MKRANHTSVHLSVSAKVLLHCYLCSETQTTNTRQVRGYAVTTWVKLWFRDYSLVQYYLAVCTALEQAKGKRELCRIAQVSEGSTLVDTQVGNYSSYKLSEPGAVRDNVLWKGRALPSRLIKYIIKSSQSIYKVSASSWAVKHFRAE